METRLAIMARKVKTAAFRVGAMFMRKVSSLPYSCCSTLERPKSLIFRYYSLPCQRERM
jgi:hypothetical protein